MATSTLYALSYRDRVELETKKTFDDFCIKYELST